MSGPSITDEDIYAFHPVPPAPAQPAMAARPRRRIWPWLLGAALLLSLVLAAIGTVALLSLIDGSHGGLHVHIGDEEWEPLWDVGQHGLLALAGSGVALFAVLVVVALVLMLVVPLSVLLALMGAALGIGTALLAAMAVLLLVLSPLWGLALLLWLLLRPRARPTGAAA